MQSTDGTTETPATIRKFGAPFERKDADLILRSSDHVDFHVHRLILSLASPVFETMFSLPQPLNVDSAPRVVDVTETSETLKTFLLILYPVKTRALLSLTHVRDALEVARKYDAEKATNVLRLELVHPRFLEPHPLRVFAIACLFGLEAEAKIAAEKAVLTNQVGKSCCPSELDDTPAGVYHRLLKLYRTRRELKSKSKATQIVIDFKGIGPFSPAPSFPPMHTCSFCPTKIESMFSVSFSDHAPDALIMTNDSFWFRVHRFIIDSGIPGILSKLQTDAFRLESMPSMPVYILPEDAMVVEHLLRTCYPDDHPPFQDLDSSTYLQVLNAAVKYKSKKAQRVLRERWAKYMKAEPLRFYFAAAAYEWDEEALRCAREILDSAKDVATIQELYIEEMEEHPTHAYRSLLSYIDDCSEAAAGIKITMTALRPRTCEGPCASRYLQQFAIDHPPQPFATAFNEIKTELRRRPSGDTSASAYRPLWVALANDTQGCWKCSISHLDRIDWAFAVISQYSAAVDAAIASVSVCARDVLE